MNDREARWLLWAVAAPAAEVKAAWRKFAVEIDDEAARSVETAIIQRWLESVPEAEMEAVAWRPY